MRLRVYKASVYPCSDHRDLPWRVVRAGDWPGPVLFYARDYADALAFAVPSPRDPQPRLRRTLRAEREV